MTENNVCNVKTINVNDFMLLAKQQDVEVIDINGNGIVDNEDRFVLLTKGRSTVVSYDSAIVQQILFKAVDSCKTRLNNLDANSDNKTQHSPYLDVTFLFYLQRMPADVSKLSLQKVGPSQYVIEGIMGGKKFQENFTVTQNPEPGRKIVDISVQGEKVLAIRYQRKRTEDEKAEYPVGPAGPDVLELLICAERWGGTAGGWVTTVFLDVPEHVGLLQSGGPRDKSAQALIDSITVPVR